METKENGIFWVVAAGNDDGEVDDIFELKIWIWVTCAPVPIFKMCSVKV